MLSAGRLDARVWGPANIDYVNPVTNRTELIATHAL